MTDEKIVDLRLPYPNRGDRLVRVFVPAHEEGETFPVVYMTDGQNVFEDDRTEFGCWYTREAVRDERVKTGEAAIIVGIFNDDGPIPRTNELTPASIGPLICPPEIAENLTPSGEIFDAFVVDTLMPAVEARFPVKTGRTNTAFCGSSSGGLQAFFTALSHPDRFCAAGVFSPAFIFYTPEDLRRWVYTKIREHMPYLYIYTGAGDELEQQIYASVERTYEDLTECYPLHLLNEVALLDQKHNEEAWAPIFGDFLHTFLTRRADF